MQSYEVSKLSPYLLDGLQQHISSAIHCWLSVHVSTLWEVPSFGIIIIILFLIVHRIMKAP